TVTFSAASTLSSLGPTLTVSSGAVNFNSGEAISVATINFSTGTIQGSDNITVPSGGSFNWSGAGTLGGSGTFTVAAGASGALTNNATQTLSGRTLVDAGTITQT